MRNTAAWRRAGLLAGSDPAKRRIVFQGLLWIVPALLLGGFVGRAFVAAPGRLTSPLTWAVSPIVAAWRRDLDTAMWGALGVQAALVLVVLSFTGLHLARLGAVEMLTGVREGTAAARRFAGRRVWRLFVARAALVAVLLGVLAAFWALGVGVVSLAAWRAVALAVLALVALAAAMALALGHITLAPVIAAEDATTREAFARAVAVLRGRPLRALGGCIAFSFAALLRSAPRVLAWGALFGVWLLLFHLLVPDAAWDRAAAVVHAGGMPADAARRGIGAMDVALALAPGLGAAAFLLLSWADVWTRVAMARTALFLHLREEGPGEVPPLRPPAEAPRHLDAGAAGFERMARLD